MKTVFEMIRDREIQAYIVYENDYVIAFLDKDPISKGHIVVTTKKVFKDIYVVDDKYLYEISIALKVLSNICKKVFRCDGINIINNNEEYSGQTVFHIHFHIIPRYKGDTHQFNFPHNNVSDKEKEEWLKLIKGEIL